MQQTGATRCQILRLKCTDYQIRFPLQLHGLHLAAFNGKGEGRGMRREKGGKRRGAWRGRRKGGGRKEGVNCLCFSYIDDDCAPAARKPVRFKFTPEGLKLV